MKARRIFIFITTLLLITAVTTGVIQAWNAQPELRTLTHLENVRTYAAAPQAEGVNYAVEGGVLFAGEPGAWTEVPTPNEIIVGSVAIDAAQPERIYIGAANELAVYRTSDQGRNWTQAQLMDSNELMTGGVIALAYDPVQQLVFAGTDTAGLFRLRDVGASMTLTDHLITNEPVREIAVDAKGEGFLFARTDHTLYRGENYGLAWTTVSGLGSTPTALAIGQLAQAETPVVYVGTTDRGVMRSFDGHNWTTANDGLNFVPGSRLHVNTLAVDPAQPHTLYVATSYLHGSTSLHATPSTVYVEMGEATVDAMGWTPVSDATLPAAAAALMPVSGQPGAVYALTQTSRTPLAMGSAPDMIAAAGAESAPEIAAQPATQPGMNWTAVLAWIVAGLAAGALVFAIVTDLRRRPVPETASGRFAEQHATSRR